MCVETLKKTSSALSTKMSITSRKNINQSFTINPLSKNVNK